MKCNPPECADLAERIAIMEHDGGVKVNLIDKAVSSQCPKCVRRGGKRRVDILEELKEVNK